MSRHIPVLLKEVVDMLNLKLGDKVADCTLGDAGHSEAILNQIGPTGKLLGIDADPESLLRAKRNLYNFSDQTIFVRDNFVHLKQILEKNNFIPVQAVLLDLGWSTPQFKERGRGFSFEGDEPLDMRYGDELKTLNSESRNITAANILNEYTATELNKIFHQYGEEKFSSEIAEAITVARKIKPLERTGELVEIILQVYRNKLHSTKDVPWIGGIHPATKIFQALRIEVNQELEVLKKVLPQAIEVLSVGGRLAVITFHSLEDRIVKQFFQTVQNKTIKLINKKPIIASEEELKINPSSRSAKLRVVERTM